MGIDLLCLGNIFRDLKEYEGLKTKSRDESLSSYLNEDVNKNRQIFCYRICIFTFLSHLLLSFSLISTQMDEMINSDLCLTFFKGTLMN